MLCKLIVKNLIKKENSREKTKSQKNHFKLSIFDAFSTRFYCIKKHVVHTLRNDVRPHSIVIRHVRGKTLEKNTLTHTQLTCFCANCNKICR